MDNQAEQAPTSAVEDLYRQATNQYWSQSPANDLLRPPGALVGQVPSEILIGKVSNGFIVKVGCQTFVSNKWEEVAEGLGLLFSKPEEAIKKYYKK